MYPQIEKLHIPPSFNLTFFLFYGTIKRRGACFRANFALRFASAKTQMQVKRMLDRCLAAR